MKIIQNNQREISIFNATDDLPLACLHLRKGIVINELEVKNDQNS
jgi:hypothetical protein